VVTNPKMFVLNVINLDIMRRTAQIQIVEN